MKYKSLFYTIWTETSSDHTVLIPPNSSILFLPTKVDFKQHEVS